MYALIPREMLASGSWLTPTLNGVPYLDKPHLIYWLNLLAYKIFGVSDWVARLPLLGADPGGSLGHLPHRPAPVGPRGGLAGGLRPA